MTDTLLSFETGYLDRATGELDTVIDEAADILADIDFDTLVGTGLSGALVVPALAMRMGKHFVLVRKRHDGSHHNGKAVGHLGLRWVFVDDFVSSGQTRERVIEVMDDLTIYGCHPSRYVGDYFYAGTGKFRAEFDADL